MSKRQSTRYRAAIAANYLFNPQPVFFPTYLSAASAQHPASDTPLLDDETNRQQLRQRLRKQRRAISTQQQRRASQRLTKRILGNPELLRVRHLALYLANDGEIDPHLLIPSLAKRGIQLYLPILRPLIHNQLWFVRLTPGTKLVANRFGILEPETRFAAHPIKRLPAWALDAILMPLVGFDAQGGRLGMGGGFYDRSLSFIQTSKGPKPRLYGLAHACQRVKKLPLAPWDIPLNGIISDEHWWSASDHSKNTQ